MQHAFDTEFTLKSLHARSVAVPQQVDHVISGPDIVKCFSRCQIDDNRLVLANHMITLFNVPLLSPSHSISPYAASSTIA